MDFDDTRRKRLEQHPVIQKMMRDSAEQLIKDWQKQYHNKNGNELRKSLEQTMKQVPEIGGLVSMMLEYAKKRGFTFEDEGGLGI